MPFGILDRARKMQMALAIVAGLTGTAGCGPYEPEPRMPVGESEPPSSEELAREQAQARQAQTQTGPSGEAPAEPPPSDVAAEPTNSLPGEGSPEIAIGVDEATYSDTDSSALKDFQPVLAPYGTWVDDSAYGTVWVPSERVVGPDFQPYVSSGYWAYDNDWVWVSDYEWGWVPFHYGRWVYISGRGWAWIPGRTYAGAWVVWRWGGPDYGYVGWAPAPPLWYWYHGVPVGFGFHVHPAYVYCPREYVYRPGVYHHIVRGPAADGIAARTVPYVPATPSVGGGGRTVAAPTVGGPAGGGAAGVAGAAGAAGQAYRGAATRGPRPSELGVPADAVATPPQGHAGLERARAYATPRTAISLGAAPPAMHVTTDRPVLAPSPGVPRALGGSAAPSSPRLDAPRASINTPPTRGPLPETRPSAVARPTPYATPGASLPAARTPVAPSAPRSVAPMPTPPAAARMPSTMPRVAAPPVRVAPAVPATPRAVVPSAPHTIAPSAPAAPHVAAPSAPSIPHSSGPRGGGAARPSKK